MDYGVSKNQCHHGMIRIRHQKEVIKDFFFTHYD